MAELLHRIRRWLWLLRNPMRRVELLREHGLCLECGVKLTADERTYYDMNCERCEGFTLYAGRAMHPDCSAPDCDCEPGIECAARGAARGVTLPAPARHPALDRVYPKDTLAALYEAWHALPACNLLAVIGSAIQDLQAHQEGNAGVDSVDGGKTK